MARKFLVAVDLAQNELQNARVQNLASAPGSPVSGQFWYNTTSGRIEYRGTSGTIDPTARANHSGTQTASTISDLATTVQAYRLDQFAAPTASVSFNSQRIINVLDPTSAQDAATKNYVDNLVNGTDWKASVRVASTANIATLSGLLTIDGITLVANDRVLVKDQSTASANGIYVAGSGAWTRAADAVQGTLTANAAVMVEEGTSNQDTQWRITTNNPITVGTTSITWTQFGAGTSYTQGTGISIGGNTISIDTTIVARKFTTTIGDGSSTALTITHSLGNQFVNVQLFEVATNAQVEADVVLTSTSAVTATFVVAPTSNSIRAVVTG